MKAGTKSKAPEPPPRPSGAQLAETAERWRIFRRLYPIYREAAQQFNLAPPCSYLDTPVDHAAPQATAKVEEWFAAMDECMEAWHLRQIVQTTALSTEEVLRGLILRFLAKSNRTALDRDRVDFLLVQYLEQCAPAAFESGPREMEDVAAVLEPVLGEASTLIPRWLAPLEDVVAELEHCRSLRDLLERGVIERARALKEKSGPMYFGSSTLIAFARFNYLMRRGFFGLLYGDLEALRACVRELENHGVKHINATAAQLSEQEPLAKVREICAGWKKPFRAPYAAGQALRQLITLRAIVEATLNSMALPKLGAPAHRKKP